ncbi:MAG: hypothetical protein ACYC0U_07055, partial [Ilumatobacteraceae bacterium]
ALVLRAIEVLELDDPEIDITGISTITLKSNQKVIGLTIPDLLLASSLNLVMHWLHTDDRFKENVEDLVKDRHVGTRIIRDSIGEAISRSFDSRSEHRFRQVHAESVSKLFGGMEALMVFIEKSLSESQFLDESEVEALNFLKNELSKSPANQLTDE